MDYEDASEVKALADRHGVALLIIGHCRKLGAADPVEEVSGTMGFTGAADAVTVLRRERGQQDATLHITGRDVEEQALALAWNADDAHWSILGQADEYRLSAERQAVIDLLRQSGIPMTPSQVGAFVGQDRQCDQETSLVRCAGGPDQEPGRRKIHGPQREKETGATAEPEEPEGGARFFRVATVVEPGWRLAFRFPHRELRGCCRGFLRFLRIYNVHPAPRASPSKCVDSLKEVGVDLRQKQEATDSPTFAPGASGGLSRPNPQPGRKGPACRPRGRRRRRTCRRTRWRQA